MNGEYRTLGLRAGVLGNVLILAWLSWVVILHSFSPDLYYLSVQEDEYLEWSTFWGFAVAAMWFSVAALRQRRATGRFPWFLLGVGLFCFAVAMEEISWAQRIIGYRPPQYFLKENFQQELNLHNVFSTDARKLTLQGVIVVYGVLLPMLASVKPVGRLLDSLAIVAPPRALIPAFLAMLAFYVTYPLDYAGETVELMLALAFLFCGRVSARWQGALSGRSTPGRSDVAVLAFAWLLALGSGIGTAGAERFLTSGSVEKLAQARLEVAALAADLETIAESEGERYATECNRHKRLYSYELKYRKPLLYKGSFAAFLDQGVPEERTKYFIDPWNSPYWIRDRCAESGSGRVVFVYSFGPNRKRDSTRVEILGDDVGASVRPINPKD